MNEISFITNADGSVNADELIKRLEGVNSTMKRAVQDVKEIYLSLGGDDETSKEEQKKDIEHLASTQGIINACTVSGNEVRLPQVQLDKKTYGDIKKTLEKAGGKWTGRKTQAFCFPFNPERIMNDLRAGKKINLQQDFQFFETPDDLADYIVKLAELKQSDKILEPSAGRGAIIKAIKRTSTYSTIDCFEIMPENREILSGLSMINLIGCDFLIECKSKYDKIIANPPFSDNQDMTHVRKMYDSLNSGGRLVAITGQGYVIRSDRKAVEFREWLNSVNAVTIDLEKGKFKKSGTNVATNILIIDKK